MGRSARRAFAIAIALACIVSFACGQSSNELSAYTSAVARVNPGDRLFQLEQFAMHARPGPLKAAALEIVIWEHMRTLHLSQALTWADELARTDPNNAIALALMSNEDRAAMDRGEMKPARLLAMASHGLDTLPFLTRPLGMSPADFSQLETQASALLSGAAGWAELRRKDYPAARVYLHNAVAFDANNAQNIYALALADLDGPHANADEGYWYLARAVDLSQGTPQGAEIARFARARYRKDGGSSVAWDQFLASAAAAPGQGAGRNTLAATANPPSLAPRPPAKAVQPATTLAVKRPPPVTKPSSPQPAPSVWADDTSPTAIVRRRIPAATGPMSLGILIETSLATKADRSAVVNSLTDMLRRMDDRDEAFILTYDHNLIFAQDLTSDPEQLGDAMEAIKPEKGAVLDDAVAFAAGHLARIAKNANRVLLVVSDG
ncbi:MAG TPA: hypothetical protein VL240_03335, partial [Candidatus Binatia bacterium]|nr:hypothetical protein [Candidatus Binatia bacterium]